MTIILNEAGQAGDVCVDLLIRKGQEGALAPHVINNTWED